MSAFLGFQPKKAALTFSAFLWENLISISTVTVLLTLHGKADHFILFLVLFHRSRSCHYIRRRANRVSLVTVTTRANLLVRNSNPHQIRKLDKVDCAEQKDDLISIFFPILAGFAVQKKIDN